MNKGLFSLALLALAVAATAGGLVFPDRVTQRVEEIEQMIAEVPRGPHCGTGIRWYAWARQPEPYDAIVALSIIAASTEDKFVRRQALWALGEQRRPELFALWQQILDSDDDASVRSLAAVSLGKLRDPAATAILARHFEDDPMVIVGAIQGIQEIGDPAARPWLEPLLHSPKDQVRYRALKAYVAVSDDLPVDALVRGLEDTVENIRFMAVRKLGETGRLEFLPRILGALKDPQPRVRRAAEDAVCFRYIQYLVSPPTTDIPTVEQALEDSDDPLHASPRVLYQLGWRYEEEGDTRLAARLYRESAEVWLRTQGGLDLNFEWGPTAVFRLAMMSLHSGNWGDARRLVEELGARFAGTARVYARDFPVPGTHMTHEISELVPRMLAAIQQGMQAEQPAEETQATAG